MESMASDPFNGQVFYVGTETAGVTEPVIQAEALPPT